MCRARASIWSAVRAQTAEWIPFATYLGFRMGSMGLEGGVVQGASSVLLWTMRLYATRLSLFSLACCVGNAAAIRLVQARSKERKI